MAGTGFGKDFWLLWSGSTVSNAGDGIRIVALPLLTAAITDDPFAIGAVTAASVLPWLLFSLIGGAIVDRGNRRKLILVGQAIRGLSVLGFATLVATDHYGLAAIYLIAFIIGTGEVVVDSAMQAAVPQVAGDDLDSANSKFMAAQFVAGHILGGPIGGALFVFSAALPFFVDAASFAIGGAFVAAIVTPLQDADVKEKPETSIWDDIKEGARFVRNQPVLRGLVVSVSLVNISDAATSSLLVLLVLNTIGSTEYAFGLVIAAAAAGGLLGAMTAARMVERLGRRMALVVAFGGMVAGQTVTAIAPNVVIVGLGGFAVMGSIGLFNVSAQSIRQKITPDRLLGRAIATMRFVAMGAIPVGALGGGLIARYIGIRETMLLSAGVAALATAVIIRSTAGRDLETPAPDPVQV